MQSSESQVKKSLDSLCYSKEIEILPQVGAEFQMVSNKVFMIPWGHIKLLIDKCNKNQEKVCC